MGPASRGRPLVVVCLVTVLSAPLAAGAQYRVRFHGYVQWIAGSKMVVWIDAGSSVTVDLSEADPGSYICSVATVTVEAEVRRRSRRDSDEIPLVAKTIELDKP